MVGNKTPPLRLRKGFLIAVIRDGNVRCLNMSNNLEMKKSVVAEIKGKFEKAKTVVLVDYRGLTVAEDTELRNQLRKAGVEYVVLKNHIVNRAAQANGVDESFHNYLKGPSAFAFGYDDAVAPARILKDTVKKLKKCEIKGGIINGVVTDAAGMNTLADLPSREQLIARLLGSMMSPISKLAIVLGQIQEQKGGSDAAPAEAAE